MTQAEEFQIDNVVAQLESQQFNAAVLQEFEQKSKAGDIYFTFRPLLVSLQNKWWIGKKIKGALKAIVTILDVFFSVRG